MMKPYLSAKRLFFVWIVLALALSWGLSPAHAADAQLVRVAVASNFIAPMKALSRNFEAATGALVLVSAGSTGKLYAQIKNGAPFDVFLAANAREPQRLDAEGLSIADARFTYAQGRLALWCRTAASPGEAEACLRDDSARLAIANPRLAPYGQAAAATLAALQLTPRTVNGENIAQAFQLVWSGNVPQGFVALSQVRARDDLPGAYWVVPANLHPAIEQQAVLLRRGEGNAAARTFFEYLQSDAAQQTIAAFGYDVNVEVAEGR